MAKYTKQIELLNRLADEGEITITCKSEKTAVAEFRKMKKFIETFRPQAFMTFPNEDVTNWCYVNPSFGDESFGPYNEIKPIGLKLIERGVLSGKQKYEDITIDDCKKLISIWGKKPEYYPHFVIKLGSGKYKIEWKQGDVTKTSKRGTEEFYQQKLKEVSEKIGTINAVPNELWISKDRKKVTEDFYSMLITLCDEYINGEKIIPQCSPKQAIWVSKMLGISETAAQTLNKVQASEILDVLFNSNGIYTDNDKEITKKFYLEKILKQENMKTVNESDIRNMVAEALKRVLSENFEGEYRTKGSLNKKTLEKNAGKSAEEIIADRQKQAEEDEYLNPDWEDSVEDILSKYDDEEEFDDSTAGEYKIDHAQPFFYDKGGRLLDADAIGNFHNDFAIIKKDGKCNFVNHEGKQVADDWFDACNDFENGFAVVAKDGKRNFINGQGEYLLDTWVNRAGDFVGGYAPIIINGQRMEVDTNGNIQ